MVVRGLGDVEKTIVDDGWSRQVEVAGRGICSPSFGGSREEEHSLLPLAPRSRDCMISRMNWKTLETISSFDHNTTPESGELATMMNGFQHVC